MGYLTAFFNSKIFRFAFKDFFPELLGDTRELSKVFFENVTIKEVGEEELQRFERLVDEVQNAKKEGNATVALEAEIERRIAAIYALSESELTLIESKEGVGFPIEERTKALSSAVSS